MHQIQKKLLELAKQKDISELGYRKIGRLIKVEHPQKVKYHLLQLKKKGYLNLENKTNIVKAIKDVSEIQPEFVEVPLVGEANCGPASLFAEESIEGYLNVSTSITGKIRGLYALRASGNSMDEANIKGKPIKNGDIVLIDYQDKNYQDGDYVVSVIDGCANIKRLKKSPQDNKLILVSKSSEHFAPIVISEEDSFIITGKVVDVIKGDAYEN